MNFLIFILIVFVLLVFVDVWGYYLLNDPLISILVVCLLIGGLTNIQRSRHIKLKQTVKEQTFSDFRGNFVVDNNWNVDFIPAKVEAER